MPPVSTFHTIPADQRGRGARTSRAIARLKKLRNIRWVVLTVAVEGRNPSRAGRPDAGQQGRTLAAFAGVADEAQVRYGLCRLAHQRRRIITAPIIDDDDFEVRYSVKGNHDFLNQINDVVGFVVDWDDDR